MYLPRNLISHLYLHLLEAGALFYNMPASTPRIRPYKDFLTPALHRRFARATVILMGLCYLEAVYIGEWNSCKHYKSSREALV